MGFSNPLKIVLRGLKAGGRGMKVAYRQATRPEVMAVLQIGGMVFPPLNALGVLKFMTFAKEAEAKFKGNGRGTVKLQWVLTQASMLMPELKRMGVPRNDWVEYIETALLLINFKKASLVSEDTGRELLETDLARLAELFGE